MNKKDDEIQRKLDELEKTILKEAPNNDPLSPVLIPTDQKRSRASADETPEVKSDLCYFGGIASLIFGLYLMFDHIRVGTGFMNILGMGGQGFGLMLLPLIGGVGWLIYDSRNKWAKLMVCGTLVAIFLSVVCSLVMTFPMMKLTELLFMLFWFALGGGLLVKGVGGPKGVQKHIEKFKSS